MISMENNSTPEVPPTVFIVEDDHSTREALQELIRPSGVNIIAAGSAEEFLNRYDPNLVGCLILDQQLPGIDGCELLRQLRADEIHLPAVLVTAYATTTMAVEAMKLGAVNVLEKPCAESQLREAVDQAIAVSKEHSSRLARRRGLANRIEQLSDNEREVLTHVLNGVPNKQIASVMNVCIRTIEARRSRIYKTMGVQSVAELARASVSAGFIEA